MSTKMRAALLDEVGAPMIVVDDVELDGPGLGEVRVEVAWCGVCHSDVSQVDGVHPALTPSVLGHEAAGVVVEVGPGVTRWKIGDQVCALLPGGGYAEYVATPEAHALPIPKGMSAASETSSPRTSRVTACGRRGIHTGG